MPSLTKKPTVVALLIILSGALQTLTLAPIAWWPLGPISIILLVWATQALDFKVSGKPVLYGWLFGLGLFGSGASWVYVSIHTYGYAPAPLAAFLTIVFVAGLALFCAFQFWLYYKIRSTSMYMNAVIFAAIWLLSDAFRTDFLTGFPWLFLGYGHLSSPLAGWIPVLGVYGITTLVVGTGLALYLCIQGYNSKKNKIIAASTLAVWLAGYPLNEIKWTTEQNEKLSVAMLQINIPQELKWLPSQRRKTIRLLENMSVEAWDHDLIIWPETAIPMLYDQALPFLKKFGNVAKTHNTNIITGIPYRELNEQGQTIALHNSIFSFGEGDGIYHKQKLVPFGEYVPLQDLLRGLIAFFDLPMSDFRKGPPNQDLLLSHDWSVAPFICYEVVYPNFVAKQAQGADYLLTISNDSWFGASIGPLQHLEMAQMRAAENGRYMVRATNNGVSAMINEKGQIVAQSEQFVATTLSSQVTLFDGQTPFSRIQSTPLFVLASGIVFFFVLIRRRHKNVSGKDQSSSV